MLLDLDVPIAAGHLQHCIRPIALKRCNWQSCPPSRTDSLTQMSDWTIQGIYYLNDRISDPKFRPCGLAPSALSIAQYSETSDATMGLPVIVSTASMQSSVRMPAPVTTMASAAGAARWAASSDLVASETG